MTPPLPDRVDVAFKEWSGVCDALARGEQSLILRKGGIEEGPRGFVPEHPRFWLYPTFVHQAEQGLRPPLDPSQDNGPAPPAEGSVTIGTLAVVEVIGRADRLEELDALEDLHIWTEETVRKRFSYRRPGLWVLGVRILVSPSPATIPATPGHAGCKSWVPLETPLSTAGLVPALDPSETARRMGRIREALGLSRALPATELRSEPPCAEA